MTPRDRFLKSCRREPVDRRPVWMMRQAGRYLPEYRAIRKTHSTLAMMKNPDIACEITLQPVDRLGVDAAILYSDILMVPEAMGLKLDFVKDVGPSFDRAILTAADVEFLDAQNVAERCAFVAETLVRIRRKTGPDFPVLGFAGAPFTVAAYMTAGTGAEEGHVLKKLAWQDKPVFRRLMEKITLATIDYLKMQVRSGADALQLFDTWAGTLSENDFVELALPYARSIFSEIAKMGVPSIYYIKGGSPLLEKMMEAAPSVVSIDWRTDIGRARAAAGGRSAIQGNLDPALLYAPPPVIEARTRAMLDEAGPAPGYIVNLGHGIMPDVPVENAQCFIESVKRFGLCHG